MASRIAIVFGAGQNIGTSTVNTFKAAGYKVAHVSRSADGAKDDNTYAVSADLTKPSSVSNVFDKVRGAWGEPSVVVYNAAAVHFTEKEKSLDVATEDFETDLAINTTSAFVAAREAFASFQKSSGPRTFLYTGNATLAGPLPGALTLGVGKNATAHVIRLAEQQFRDQDIRFVPLLSLPQRYFFVDERKEDGKPMFTGLGGQAHADFFLSLAERKTAGEVPYNATFVSGKGYTEFPNELIL
ncbi:hypothetical protein LTR37_008312 [Vermiconidia calcicola]|uniref:Uncharacterized protein n=1 Tax=Vermiconidia calcicola TaxID=1690605 RepID=A0ACC3NBK7_9PEZI|nr:hypothetical protein LTR37_008312 [Vermiconidia calcicola]